jgi:hypothetical protein
MTLELANRRKINLVAWPHVQPRLAEGAGQLDRVNGPRFRAPGTLPGSGRDRQGRADSCVVPVPPDIDSAVATAYLDRKYP